MRLPLSVAITACLSVCSLAVAPAASYSGTGASSGDSEDAARRWRGDVPICHSTGEPSSPYVRVVVTTADVRRGSAHNREEHQHGRDIIPPGWYDRNGRNWEGRGRAIYRNGCDAVAICHATGKPDRPYVWIRVSTTAVQPGRGHNQDPHQGGADIVPPGPYDPDGRNWTEQGRTIYRSGCRQSPAPANQISAISAGFDHTCALLTAGTIKCWGSNWQGELGVDPSTVVSTSIPVDVPDVATAIAIDAGSAHTCAVLNTGKMVCWGNNDYGQVGDGTVQTPRIPTEVRGIDGAIAVATGSTHTCALRQDGRVLCWGENSSGQLGDGTFTNSLEPHEVLGITSAAGIAASQMGTCAVLVNAAVLCWGSNNDDQLGPTGPPFASATPVPIQGVTDAVDVVLGGSHVCARIDRGAVRCWGDNSYGQLGGGSARRSVDPVDVEGITASSIDAGPLQTCAVTIDRTVTCWGVNGYDDWDYTTSPTPVTVDGVDDAMQVATGHLYSCALVAESSVTCWGQNDSGQLGDGTFDNSTVPVEVVGLDHPVVAICHATDDPLHPFARTIADVADVQEGVGHNSDDHQGGSDIIPPGPYDPDGRNWGGVQQAIYDNLCRGGVRGIATAVSAGSDSTCAVLATGHVACWGDNEDGKLGDGTVRSSPVPVAVKDIDTAAAISVGPLHACALLHQGSVACWGGNYYGSLGDGTYDNSAVAVRVVGIDNASKIVSGTDHVCAVLDGGSVRCWGAGDMGQLGSGTMHGSPLPVDVIGITDPVELVAGDSHTCALLHDGTVSCWGGNFVGQLGNGTFDNAATPVTVGGITGAVAIAAGEWNTCALLDNAIVKCWGYNEYGHLLDGTYQNSAAPITVARLADARSLEVGGVQGCALTNTGLVRCWGVGWLGNGNAPSEPTSPVTVTGLTGASAITVADGHSCALTTGGAIMCWGDNLFGELGDGTSGTTSATPVRVAGLGP